MEGVENFEQQKHNTTTQTGNYNNKKLTNNKKTEKKKTKKIKTIKTKEQNTTK